MLFISIFVDDTPISTDHSFYLTHFFFLSSFPFRFIRRFFLFECYTFPQHKTLSPVSGRCLRPSRECSRSGDPVLAPFSKGDPEEYEWQLSSTI